MATTQDKVTYIFLASRLYPYTSDEYTYDSTDGNGAVIQKKAGQEIVALDVTTKFSNTWDANVSSYAISAGADISDHISIRNNKYTLEGIISDTPMESHPQESLGQIGTGGHRVAAAIELLDLMYRNRVIFTLFSEYQQLKDVVITNVSFDQESQFAAHFTIQMEQVRFAYARTVTLNVKNSAKKTVASNKNGGGSTKATAEVSNYRTKKDSIVAKNNANGG